MRHLRRIELVGSRQQSHGKAIALMLVKLLVVAGIAIALIAHLLPSVGSRPVSPINSCRNNLKQVNLALHAYSKDHGTFPPAYTVDANGKPLHSWRTLILPYLEEKNLYESIDLDKPWDDPVNATAYNTKILVYQCPALTKLGNRTNYLAVVSPDSCLRPANGVKISDITDDPSPTLTIIEVPMDDAVPWMAPQDADEKLFLSLNEESRLPHKGGFHVGFADGHLEFISSEQSESQRRAMITIAGGESPSNDSAK